MVASHTETPLGVSKWLEQELSQKYQPAFTVGDMVNSCPLHSSKVVFVWCRFTSHFAVPIGTAVWLANFVRCLTASSFFMRIKQCPSFTQTYGDAIRGWRGFLPLASDSSPLGGQPDSPMG